MLLAVAFALSFMGSVPMTGPLAALVLERSLAGARKSATLIAVSGSVVEGAIAGALATFVPALLAHSETLIRAAGIAGACILLLVGALLAAAPNALTRLASGNETFSLRAGFLATALNPTLLATWTVVVTSLYGQAWLSGGFVQGLSFGLGVALGSFGWFALVVSAVRHLDTRIARYRLPLLRGLGLVLSIAALVLLVRAFAKGA